MAQALEMATSVKEQAVAIKSTSSGKTPGLDDFTLGYYKQYGQVLGSHFGTAFNLLQTTPIPLVILWMHIPKQGKDPSALLKI